MEPSQNQNPDEQDEVDLEDADGSSKPSHSLEGLNKEDVDPLSPLRDQTPEMERKRINDK